MILLAVTRGEFQTAYAATEFLFSRFCVNSLFMFYLVVFPCELLCAIRTLELRFSFMDSLMHPHITLSLEFLGTVSALKFLGKVNGQMLFSAALGNKRLVTNVTRKRFFLSVSPLDMDGECTGLVKRLVTVLTRIMAGFEML